VGFLIAHGWLSVGLAAIVAARAPLEGESGAEMGCRINSRTVRMPGNAPFFSTMVFLAGGLLLANLGQETIKPMHLTAPLSSHLPPSTDALATAVIVVDGERITRYINPAAENLLGISASHALGRPLVNLTQDCTELVRTVEHALLGGTTFTEHDLELPVNGHSVVLGATVTPLDGQESAALIELHPAPGNVRIARDEQVMAQSQASQTLLRQLAHEIRNPLGGIRGAAQLLEAELEDSELREYTQVVIQETNRLQSLLDKLLTPAKRPVVEHINIHEVLERVRSVLLAEFTGLTIRRDYDISLPDLTGDPEQLIQAVLNIARNAAQAMEGRGRITLKTRIARQVTLAMKRWRQAIRLDVVDNGPGIPEDILGQVFLPLVSGREGGSGLGLTLAQSLVQRHDGAIHVDSRPGHTCFSIYLPIK
jgi:two-component system, NtrC family, nitrogen regulation sensor histidine kinase GlnL